MAEKRMFSKKIIDSDAFLDMPLSAQALYFHISMRADDDGFVDKPKSILRTVRANEDDFKILLAKRFLIPFDSGVCVVKHWWMNNYIQKDRYTPTVYKDEKSLLQVKENKAYTEVKCIQPVYNMDTQISIDKISIDKNRLVKDISAPTEPPFIVLPAIRNDFEVSYKYLEELKETYPAVDVEQQLKEMKMWLDSNPSNKKVNTKSFITRWLGKEQDKGIGKPIIKSDPKPKEEISDEEVANALAEFEALKERARKKC